ncbi:MAG: dTMP kinase [Firmicutes bacterium]|nr:dTMP kinase [Bacillota bacterium]
MAGLFITFEGPDGSGKTTQAALLVEKLKHLGYSVLFTREPGGTDLGRVLRKLLLEPGSQLAAMTEVLLMAADRAQHVEEVIKPALQNNMIVICDRYVDSSLAYQGFALLGDVRSVKMINEAATGGLWPDLTLLLDVDVEVGLKRHLPVMSSRDNAVLDRIEQRDLAFHEKVRQGYQELQKIYPRRFAVVDTTFLKIEDISEKIWRNVQQRLRTLDMEPHALKRRGK